MSWLLAVGLCQLKKAQYPVDQGAFETGTDFVFPRHLVSRTEIVPCAECHVVLKWKKEQYTYYYIVSYD